MISSVRYWFLLFLVVMVYIVGMCVPLFENDSAQFAVMAMRMVQENDFINLIKGTQEYLDKPHMHYWLAALSFKIFGIHDWAYRIPAILCTLLGAHSCHGLGKLLYNRDVGRFSALIFMTAQTIVLSNIDVRTDAVLTGFTIFSIWQLVRYVEKGTVKGIVLGALGAGMAFSTKGQIALLVIGVSVLCHMAHTKKWKSVLNWKVLLALLVLAVAIAPMLYAYYQQFDLHPEKVIRGKTARSGIFFIFWEQGFERLSGEGVGKNSSDFFFFFHTFLWVFLPWTAVALFAYWDRVKTFWKSRFQNGPGHEFLTLGGITILFFIISFAQFKLPHYMNILIPLYSILSASYLYGLYRDSKKAMIKILVAIQYVILGAVFIFMGLVGFYVFRFENVSYYAILLFLLVMAIYFSLKRDAPYLRVITLSVYGSLLLNGVMNAHFYPSLLRYQAGSAMAEKIAERQIPVDNVHKISERFTWALDFYNKKPVKMVPPSGLMEKHDVWIYADNGELEQLGNKGFHWDEQITVDQFHITRLQARFLNPRKRAQTLNKMHLVRLD